VSPADIRSVTALRDGMPVRTATPYWEMQARFVAFNEENPEG